MNFAGNIIINSYSIIILVIISVYSSRYIDKKNVKNRLYQLMVYITIMLLIADILSRFDGRPETIIYPILNHTGNFIIFLTNPLLPCVWILFICYQIKGESNFSTWLKPLIAVDLLLNTIFLLLSQKSDLLYYIDKGNIYHRGPLFICLVINCIFLTAFSIFLVLANRRKIEEKYLFFLIFFTIPPIIGTILQTFFYGISLVINFVVLSLLIIFLNMQNRNLYTDYLTGVGNRKKFESYLSAKINASYYDKTFSAIMIDMDDFKSINDKYGHDMGDDALEATAKILTSCIRSSNDLIFRFGGDEFYIILDVSNKKDLKATVKRIENAVAKYNNACKKPYRIDLSMGYGVYEAESKMSMNEFLKHLDKLMYTNKRNAKKISKDSMDN